MKRARGTGRWVLRLVAGVAICLGVATPAWALLGWFDDGIGLIRIDGNTVRAGINIPGVLGTEFILRFENAQGLTANNLGLSATLFNPLDPRFRARMPQGVAGLLSVPLPLMLVVEPPANGGLQFRNTVEAEIHTHLLGFTLDSPLRLYKSPHNGRFHDITNEVARGSVRTRGTTGGFSDFIIVLDLLPSREHAEDKYEYLDQRLDNPAIAAGVRALLEQDLAESRAAFVARNYPAAQTKLAQFVSRVRTHAGVGIPNLWRSQRDRDNIAGDLLGNADSLSFSIDRASRNR